LHIQKSTFERLYFCILRKILPQLCCLFLFCFAARAQNYTEYPTSYFRSPLDIPLVLSGNFGELRPNHFHSGIDIKTQGVVGKKVYCVANGYVSRIKISLGGYGKALYITHPNGFTSVYAHLDRFSPEIETYIKAAQYGKQSYTIELFPSAKQFALQKGDLIALSGNSGGSLAPHLHFEIRDTKSEEPLNPLLFGFDITDNIPPVLRSISIYPIDQSSSVDGMQQRKDFPLTKTPTGYLLRNQSPPRIRGKVGFGIETYDLLNGAGNHCGIYSISLTHNDQPLYAHSMDRFSFYETRYLNTHMDYGKYVKRNIKTQRSYLQSNNRLRFYKNLHQKGILESTPGTTYTMVYDIKDSYGNSSLLTFKVVGDTSSQVLSNTTVQPTPVAFFKCNEKNSFQNDHLILYLPENILYEDLAFQLHEDDVLPGAITPTYRVQDESVPLQSYMMLSIKVEGISEELKRKALVVSHTKKDGIYAEGGTWKGDYIVIKTRSFGGYAVMLDTTPPSIRPINISANEDMRKKWSIMVKIADNLSGIKQYIPKVDGNWILMEYDKKRNLLTHHFDERIGPGLHTFELEVIDEVGNVSKMKTDFIR
jgi:hypothetical protein